MRILICNQKGGVGKTRMCMLIASALKNAGKNVAFEDHDRQKSLAIWAAAQPKTSEPKAGETVFVIIDTPPELTPDENPLLAQLILGADRVLLVSEVGPLELAVTKPMADFIVRTLAPCAPERRPRVSVLWNKIQARTKEGRQDLAPLAEYLGVPALRTTLPLLHCYHTLPYTGWSGLTGDAKAHALDLVLEVVT